MAKYEGSIRCNIKIRDTLMNEIRVFLLWLGFPVNFDFEIEVL